MARPLRIEFPGASYHVMNRGLEHRDIALSDEDHRRFTALLDELGRRWRVKIYAYCLMSNHYHLFLQTPQGNLARVMRHLDGLYTQSFNRAYQRDGPLFRGRYKAILVDTDDYLLTLVRYIHQNPVKAGIAQCPEDYPWSSHRLYVSHPGEAPAWLHRADVLARFKSPDDFSAFVRQEDQGGDDDRYGENASGPILGGESFVASLLEKIPRDREHPRSERHPQFPDLSSIARRVAAACGCGSKDLLVSRPGLAHMPRELAIYTAGRLAGFPYGDIGRYFGLGTVSAVSKSCWRTETRLKRFPIWRSALQRCLAAGGVSQVKT